MSTEGQRSGVNEDTSLPFSSGILGRWGRAKPLARETRSNSVEEEIYVIILKAGTDHVTLGQ